MFAIFNRRIGGALMVSAIVSLAIPAIAQSVPSNPLRPRKTAVWG